MCIFRFEMFIVYKQVEWNNLQPPIPEYSPFQPGEYHQSVTLKKDLKKLRS